MKILKFEAPWCRPCQQMTETLKQVKLPYLIQKVDIDMDMETAQQYGVRSVPTMILIDEEGVVVDEPVVGSQTAQQLVERFGGSLVH